MEHMLSESHLVREGQGMGCTPLLPAEEGLHTEPLIRAGHQGSNFEANHRNLLISTNGLLCQATKQQRKGLPESKTWHSYCLVLSWAPAAQCKKATGTHPSL